MYTAPPTPGIKIKKNIFRTKITKFFFKKEFVAAFYVVAFFSQINKSTK